MDFILFPLILLETPLKIIPSVLIQYDTTSANNIAL